MEGKAKQVNYTIYPTDDAIVRELAAAECQHNESAAIRRIIREWAAAREEHR
jgi:hypothetical protein